MTKCEPRVRDREEWFVCRDDHGAKFLTKLALQGTFRTFSRVNLPTGELPHATVALIRCSFCDEVVAIAADDRGDDMDR